MKKFNGKTIYNPSGKAGEYSYWACNFYVGCSNGCEYCYCKKGVLASTMGQNKPQLKKCFKDESHALDIFIKEMEQNLTDLQEHGLFFSFTTDPLLEETYKLTVKASYLCFKNKIPVYILTKTTWWIVDWHPPVEYAFIGFTLTGHDELEAGPECASNRQRINCLRQLHRDGYKTWASIEPIVDFDSSFKIIQETNDFCDLYKIGLMSGKKYDRKEIIQFINGVQIVNEFFSSKIYFKDSLLKQANMYRDTLKSNCVNRDYKLHKS